MCGIAGYINLDGRPLVGESATPLLTAMGDAIQHRGPDDTRIMLWENVGFIFKRLSIVDVAGGGQPMETDDGSVCAMVNGAIYNHREIRSCLAHRGALRTRSDCEVIPYLYLERGLALFAPVNGMFAVALLDRRKRRVVLGRDRLGVKPLYYCVADSGRVLVFASELKGLFAHPAVPRSFDWRGSFADLHQDTQPRELHSGFVGIERVPAAGLVDVDLDRGTLAIKEYWKLPERDEPSARRPASSYVDDYRALLEDSVRLRLMADVGYGLFLSGGIDSSMIAAIAARAGPFPTFSVLSRSTAGSGDAVFAHDVAAALGLPNHQVHFDEEDIAVTPDDWRRILWHCEMPGLTAEQLFKFGLHAYARQRYPSLKVMLLGQGSDEYNGGYLPWLLHRDIDSSPGHWDSAGRYLRSVQAEHAAAAAGIPGAYRDLFQDGTLQPGFACHQAGRPEVRETWDLYVGYYRKNLDYHLWHEDRTAAAHAIENRVPFLDFRLVEFLARIPVAHHAELFVNKAILRRAAAGILPERFAARPKGAFFYGKDEKYAFRMMYAILQRNGGELIEQAIAGSARTGGPLDPDRFRTYAARVGKDPSRREFPRLMHLVNMGLLADIADRRTASVPRAAATPVEVVGFPDWARAAARRPVADVQESGDDVVVMLAPGWRVVTIAPGEPGTLAPGVYIVNGTHADEITSPAWAKFLLQVDGRRTIGQIVGAGRLNQSVVSKHCRRAVADGVLVICSSTGEPAGRAIAVPVNVDS